MNKKVISLTSYAETKTNKEKYIELINIGDLEHIQSTLQEHSIESHVATEGLIIPIVLPNFMLDVTVNQDGYFEINLYKPSTFVSPSFYWKFNYETIEEVVLQVTALVECYTQGLSAGRHLQRIENK